MSSNSYHQGANSSKACRSQFKGSELFRAELEHPAGGRREAGGGQAEDQGTTTHQTGWISVFTQIFHLLDFESQLCYVCSGGRLATDERSSGRDPPWPWRPPCTCLSTFSTRCWRWTTALTTTPVQQKSVDGQAEARGEKIFQNGSKSHTVTFSWRCFK